MSGFRLLQNKGSTFTELINKMEITNLKQMTKEEVFNLIRQRLSFGDEFQKQLRNVDKAKYMKEHRRFEMSGFETQTGWCTVFNNDILNKFADLGIYNYTSYIKDYCNIAISFGICSRCNDLCCNRRINS